jgi:biotin/methionine sulfoxide reductase
VLTADRPTSRLSQRCAGQHAMVEVERYDGVVPEVRTLAPPRTNTPS